MKTCPICLCNSPLGICCSSECLSAFRLLSAPSLIRECHYCGRIYPKNPKAARTHTCSWQCRRKIQHIAHIIRCRKDGKKPWPLREPRKKICAICGEEFLTKGSRKLCSKKCQKRRLRQQQLSKCKYAKGFRPIARCVQCGSEFNQDRRTHVFCSYECREGQRREVRLLLKNQRTITCAICGKQTKASGATAKTCPGKCRVLLRRQRARAYYLEHLEKHRDRGRKQRRKYWEQRRLDAKTANLLNLISLQSTINPSENK